jgi:hypothetical protein
MKNRFHSDTAYVLFYQRFKPPAATQESARSRMPLRADLQVKNKNFWFCVIVNIYLYEFLKIDIGSFDYNYCFENGCYNIRSSSKILKGLRCTACAI